LAWRTGGSAAGAETGSAPVDAVRADADPLQDRLAAALADLGLLAVALPSPLARSLLRFFFNLVGADQVVEAFNGLADALRLRVGVAEEGNGAVGGLEFEQVAAVELPQAQPDGLVQRHVELAVRHTAVGGEDGNPAVGADQPGSAELPGEHHVGFCAAPELFTGIEEGTDLFLSCFRKG